MAFLIPMTFDKAVEPHLAAHLAYLEKLNLRPRSIRERRLAVLRAARRMGHPVADVDRPGLRTWQDSIGHLTPAGMHNELAHVVQYLRWLCSAEIRMDDPSPALVRPRNVRQALPHPMADRHVRRAMESADPAMHAWIGLGAFCGLRCMEIASLTAENIITGGKPHLRVTGKGGKERIVPLPASLLFELRGAAFPYHGPLFSRKDGRPGPPSAARVSDLMNTYLHSIGIPDTAHSLRHRFGTKLYEQTGDALLVAQVMGHESTDTTRMYIEIVAMKAADAIESISHLAA